MLFSTAGDVVHVNTISLCFEMWDNLPENRSERFNIFLKRVSGAEEETTEVKKTFIKLVAYFLIFLIKQLLCIDNNIFGSTNQNYLVTL